MADRNTILRHLEKSVDVDEWALIGVKEEFEKLDKIEQILQEDSDRPDVIAIKVRNQIRGSQK